MRIKKHAAVFNAKPALRKLFQDIHRDLRLLDEQWFGDTAGLRIELGAGVAPIRDSYPDVLATDIVSAPHLDQVLDAQDLRVPPGSVRSLYLQNCFHHLPDPEAFFRSAQRALAPGGGMVILEPHWGPVASVVYPRLFKEEIYDKRQASWKTPMSGPTFGANQALSFIVFKRDLHHFENLFPDLCVVDRGVMPNYIRYVLTGGLNFPQLVPTIFFPLVSSIERLISPASEMFGLHQWFVIKKK
jgi:SAM-dependent methyltransferase